MTEINETRGLAEELDAPGGEERTTFFGGAVFFMLFFIAVFANIAFGGVSTGALGLISVLVGLLVVFWVLDAWKKGEVSLSLNPLQLPLVALILIGLVQLLPLGAPSVPDGLLAGNAPRAALSLDPYATRLAVLKLFIYLIFFAACLRYVNTRKRLRTAVVTLVVFASVMAFFGVLQRLASPEFIYGIREVGQAIPFASYVNQHHFAAFLEMNIGLTLGLLFGGGTKKDKLLLLVIAVVLMGIAIVFTGSRGGWVSLLGVIGFLVLMNVLQRRKGDAGSEKGGGAKEGLRRNLILFGGSAGLIVVLLVSVMWLGGGESVLRGTGLQVNQTDFTTGRLHFWSGTLEIIRDNPVLGAGLEAFGTAYPKYDTWNGMYRLEHAHNDYLQILADAGIFGLLAVLAFIFLLFRQALRLIAATRDDFRRSVAVGALAGCFGVLVHSLFDFPLRTNANVFFFLILATLAVAPIHYPKVYRKRVRKVTGEK